MRLWKWQKQLFIKPKNLPEEQRIIPGRIGRISSLLVVEDDPEKRYIPKNKKSIFYLKQKRVRERRIIKSEYKYLPQKTKNDRIDEKLMHSDFLLNDCGLIVVDNYGAVKTIRPPRINKQARKLTDKEFFNLLSFCNYKMWNLRNKLQNKNLKSLYDQLEKYK